MAIKFPAIIELGSNFERFQLDFKICHNPDCECNGVNMVLYNENKKSPPAEQNKSVRLWLDF